MSRRASKRPVKTYAGRVIYDRPVHKFSTKDVLRIIKAAPNPEFDEKTAGSFAAILFAYWLSGMHQIIWGRFSYVLDFRMVGDYASAVVGLAVDFGQTLADDIRDRFLIDLYLRYFGGVKLP